MYVWSHLACSMHLFWSDWFEMRIFCEEQYDSILLLLRWSEGLGNYKPRRKNFIFKNLFEICYHSNCLLQRIWYSKFSSKKKYLDLKNSFFLLPNFTKKRAKKFKSKIHLMHPFHIESAIKYLFIKNSLNEL